MGTFSGFIFAKKMGENNFMGKERDPFMSGGAVGIRAADELVLAVGPLDEGGLAKPADDLLAKPLWDEVFQFHTPPLYANG